MPQMEIDRTAFVRNFGSAPTSVGHRLVDHPLLTVEAIAELAEALPERQVEHNLGNLPVVAASGQVPRAELSPGDVARGIATNGCWMVLKNIEADPRYARLLNESLDEIAEAIGTTEGGMGLREGFIFLSAPGSVTPAHIDPEHNLLLQIRGRKAITVGAFPGPDIEQRVIEGLYTGRHRNLSWAPLHPQTFSMGPGDGVYVPVHAPHWVAVPDNVAVSLSITFRTAATSDLAVVHRFNAGLRRARLSPAAVGRRPRADRLKLHAGRKIKSIAQRVKPSR
jgi:Cupin superfamily protein